MTSLYLQKPQQSIRQRSPFVKIKRQIPTKASNGSQLGISCETETFRILKKSYSIDHRSSQRSIDASTKVKLNISQLALAKLV